MSLLKRSSVVAVFLVLMGSHSQNAFADVEVGSCSCTCSGPNIDGPVDITFPLFDTDGNVTCHEYITQPGNSCDQVGNTVSCTFTPANHDRPTKAGAQAGALGRDRISGLR